MYVQEASFQTYVQYWGRLQRNASQSKGILGSEGRTNKIGLISCR